MDLKLPIGIDDFREIIEGDYLYVDKSLLVDEVWHASAKVILITRPRRFGKTINMSMLRYFFDHDAERGKQLFQGLAIEKRSCFEKAGSFPVIFLTFKDLKAPDYETFLGKVRLLFAAVYERFYDLMDCLHPFEKDRFQKVLERTCDEVELMDALAWLMHLLQRQHGRKVILLIDEYDTPIHSAYADGYFQRGIDFMRDLLGKALKGNEALEKAVVTGILRVARESIFSDLNNMRVFSLLEHPFSDKFGFTEAETGALLKWAGLEQQTETVRQWYNGYLMGNTVIYNPWSILNFMATPEQGLRPHWVNTSSNDLVRKHLLRASVEIHECLKSLLQGKYVETAIHEQTVFQDLGRDTETLWSVLLFSGYLKVVEKRWENDHQVFRLAIPNREVRYLYRQIIMGWLRRQLGSDKVNQLLESLLNGHFVRFGQLLTDLVGAVLSYYDTAAQSERVYHAFVLGLLVHLGDRYDIRSNRESGLGRYDVMLLPRDQKDRGIILEFKVAESVDKLDKALEEALSQIQKRRYGTELESAGIAIRSEIAVAFCGKNLAVRGVNVPEKA